MSTFKGMGTVGATTKIRHAISSDLQVVIILSLCGKKWLHSLLNLHTICFYSHHHARIFAGKLPTIVPRHRLPSVRNRRTTLARLFFQGGGGKEGGRGCPSIRTIADRNPASTDF